MLTRRGRPVAMLVPVDSADLESFSLSTNPDFLAIIKRSRAPLQTRKRDFDR